MNTAPTRFVVIASPRTGSNYLCGGLDSHPEVVCHAELFHPDRVYAVWRLAEELGDREIRDADPLAFLARVWTVHEGARAVGFKIFAGHNDEVLEALLADPGVRKLLLTRRNRIKTFVSELVAARTGVYQKLRESDAPPPTRVHVDPEELRRHAERRAAFEARVQGSLEGSGQDYCAVEYEDLVARPETRAGILDFLGVTRDEHLFQPRDRKQNPDDLRLLVENFGELERALEGGELAADLR